MGKILSKKSKVLIIAYQFSPKGGVGTRRWSKFAKYLASNNFEVHIVCAAYPFKDKINWSRDVEDNPSIKIHRINGNYPSFALRPKRTRLVKLVDRILQNTFYFIDPAQQWHRSLFPFLRSFLKETQIKTIFTTGGPFTPMYFSSQIKKEFPAIPLILDFRDPWSSLKTYGKIFPTKKKAISLKMEKTAIEHADKVIFTTDLLRKQYEKIYQKEKDKFRVIYNGFDKSDFLDLEQQSTTTPSFNILYPGGLSFGRIDALIVLAKAIKELNDDFINKQLVINLYTYNFIPPPNLDDDVKEVFNRNFRIHSPVNYQTILEIMANHQYCLSLNALQFPHLIGAKTFDYMALNKGILHISPEGELSKILREKKQYVATYEINSIKQQLLLMKKGFLSKNSTITNINYEEFELNHLTQQLISYIA